MKLFVHICGLMIASTSGTTGATQVQPQVHPLMRPKMHPLVHFQGDHQVHP